MSHLLQFLILLMDENLFRDPFLSPHTMAACDDCLAQGASECTCQNPETGSQLAAAGPGTHTAPAGRVRPQGRRGQGAGPRQLRGAAGAGQSVSQLWQLLGPGCRARTHSAQLTLAWRNPLSGLSTLVTWPQPALARHVTRPCWADCLHHWPGCLWPGAPVEQRAGQPGTGAEINKDYNWTLL